MSDRVLVAVPGLGVLALSPEAYKAALVEGAQLTPTVPQVTSDDERLLDSDQLAGLLQIPSTWIEAAGRDGRIPSVECGRWRRFRRSSVEAALSRGAA